MKQNKYDDPAFFARYAAMARSTGGLADEGRRPMFLLVAARKPAQPQSAGSGG